MTSQQQSLDTLKDIKRMMERSSRFISLSGWSGVSAGICALIGAWLAHQQLLNIFRDHIPGSWQGHIDWFEQLYAFRYLVFIGIGTFLAALITAFLFTYIRTRKQGLPVWDKTVQRLAWNTILPMAVGGLVILRCLQLGYYEMIAPGCLIFYGLALVNAAKYTLGEIRYLGYAQLFLGVLNLWNVGSGLLFWAIGFGILHIVYGLVMLWKYERVRQ